MTIWISLLLTTCVTTCGHREATYIATFGRDLVRDKEGDSILTLLHEKNVLKK